MAWKLLFFIPNVCRALKISESIFLFRIFELTHLRDMFPFNILGWNIGILAKKTSKV